MAALPGKSRSVATEMASLCHQLLHTANSKMTYKEREANRHPLGANRSFDNCKEDSSNKFRGGELVLLLRGICHADEF